MKTTEQVLNILKQCKIENKTVFLPTVQLDRQLYTEVNDVFIALGAKWDRKAKGHIFDYDITKEFEKVLTTGEYTNWKKETDYFYTPTAVVNEIIGMIAEPCNSNFSILEPSAGSGNILDIFKSNFPNAEITCVEMNPQHCERLREKGYSPINCKFEDYTTDKQFDYVVMNPPFTYEVEHIQKAYSLLKEGGTLVSIASGMLLNKSTGKYKLFKEWFADKGTEYNLPPNSFKESGTNVNTIMIVINKEEQA